MHSSHSQKFQKLQVANEVPKKGMKRKREEEERRNRQNQSLRWLKFPFN